MPSPAASWREVDSLGKLLGGSVSRASDLRADYELLGEALKEADGSALAAIARERRLLGAVLELLEKPEVVSRVDELAAKRAGSGVSRPPARRKSG